MPVKVDVVTDPTVETVTPGPVTVIVPLASAKRPVPPVIVLTVVATNPVDITVPVVVKVVNTLSPLATNVGWVIRLRSCGLPRPAGPPLIRDREPFGFALAAICRGATRASRVPHSVLWCSSRISRIVYALVADCCRSPMTLAERRMGGEADNVAEGQNDVRGGARCQYRTSGDLLAEPAGGSAPE